MTINELTTFLEQLKSLKFDNVGKQDANYFEIANYPHYENVISNILQFLFDTREEHKLYDLWLKSILKVYIEKSGKFDLNIEGLEVRNIFREYSNISKDRIDILIECESLLIVIENKIFAKDYNDFESYSSMAEHYRKAMADKNVEIVKIILSLFPINANNKSGFYNVKYEELFQQIAKEKEVYTTIPKWEIFQNELIENIKRRKESTYMKLDEEWIKFVSENKASISKFIEKHETESSNRLPLIKSIDRFIIDQIEKDSVFGEKINKHGVYRSTQAFHCSQFTDIKVGSSDTICIETFLSNNIYDDKNDYGALYIALWNRSSKHFEKYGGLIDSLPVKERERYDGPGPKEWGAHYVLQEINLRETIQIAEVVEEIIDYVERVYDFLTDTI
ncbi:MAG: PD-(D/E)XK nuclease family protein [Bacilli bacterium]|nr:PD-(D/E)XK nuclease family protein [Bacilli bacterium]